MKRRGTQSADACYQEQHDGCIRSRYRGGGKTNPHGTDDGESTPTGAIGDQTKNRL